MQPGIEYFRTVLNREFHLLEKTRSAAALPAADEIMIRNRAGACTNHERKNEQYECE
jgi:hypothetical protein